MVIYETNITKEQIDRMDAYSRVAIQFLEDASTPNVARYGDFSYDAIGHSAISPDGDFALSVTPVKVVASQITDCLSLPNSFMMVRLRDETTGEPTKHIKLSIIPPQYALSIMQCAGVEKKDIRNYDYRPLAEKLGRLDRNYDTLSANDGPIVRVADDRLIPKVVPIPSDCELVPLYDSHNKLIEYDCARKEDGMVCSVKIFKFIASPGIFHLPFRSEKPGVWFKNGKSKNCVIDTDIKTVMANDDIAWLNDAGDLEKMDWNVLSDGSAIVWHCKYNQLEANALLRRVLSIVAIAKKKGIALDVIKATCREGHGECASEIRRLDLNEIRIEALRRHIELPESLRNSDYLIRINSNPMIETSRLPDYWKFGPMVVLYPAEKLHVLQILSRLAKDLQKTRLSILILIDKKMNLKVEYALKGHCSVKLQCADINVLHCSEELKRIVNEYQTEVLLVMFESNDVDNGNPKKDARRDSPQQLTIQIASELLLPVGLILPSSPSNESSWLYDCVYCIESDDGKLSFVDKPEKAKPHEQSRYAHSKKSKNEEIITLADLL